MEKLLSKQEIDQLLEALVDTKPSNDLDYDPNEIVGYNLVNPDKFIASNLPVLEQINDKFSQTFRTTLSASLRRAVIIRPQPYSHIAYKKFIDSLAQPQLVNIFKLNPLKGNSLLIFEPALNYVLVDLLFGGIGRYSVTSAKRELTNLEMRMLSKVTHSALDAIGEAWNNFAKITVNLEKTETNAKLLSLMSDNDLLVVTPFEIEINQLKMHFNLAIPALSLEPIKTKLTTGSLNDTTDLNISALKRLSENVKSSEVELQINLGKTKLSLRNFLQLSIGDPIVLDQHISTPLDVMVSNQLKFKGIQGAYQGNVAIQIKEIIKSKKTEDPLFIKNK